MLLWILLAQDADIDRLSSDRYEERREAVEALVRRGKAALPALEAAARSEDPEVAARAREALERIRGLFDLRRGAAVDPPLAAALGWLERHPTSSRCECFRGANPVGEVGLDALALLAFLAADRRDEARLAALLRAQDWEGCLGERGEKHMYAHAIGTLALAESYALSEAERLKEPAQRAVDFLVKARNAFKGWRYTSRCGDNDTSVTFWAALALAVAREAKLDVPTEAFKGTRAWLNDVTDEAYGRVGYVSRHTKCQIPGRDEGLFDHHESMTAIGVFTRRMILGEPAESHPVRNGALLLLYDPPSAKADKVDFYYWHVGALALRHEPSAGAKKAAWKEALGTSILSLQRKEGCAAGSWDPADRWGPEGGRIYATAINALTLRTDVRYRPRGAAPR